MTPASGDEWFHYQADTEVRWEYIAEAEDSVTIELYKNDVFVAIYAENVMNTGSYYRHEGIDPSWGTGSKYTLKITDSSENYGWSERFTISNADIIRVTEPTAETVWVHNTTENTVEWETEGLLSSTVDIELYRSGEIVEILARTVDNTGVWVYTDPIPDTLMAGENYSIRIVDNFDDWGWSENFTISGAGGEIYTITEPSGGTEWLHYQTGTFVRWETIDGSIADDVTIDLYSNDVFVASYAEQVPNSGFFTRVEGIDATWSTGSKYTLKVYDTSGNYGWSERFTISNADVINVTEPDVSTEWMHNSVDNRIEWDVAGMQGTSVEIALYKNSVFIEALISDTGNTGSWIYTDPVPESWTADSDYQIMLRDNFGDWGYSADFSIIEQTAPEQYTVTEPSPSTVWTHYDTNLTINWQNIILSADDGVDSGETISIFLYEQELLIDTLVTWTTNDGYWNYSGPVPVDWAPGAEYKIYVEDDAGGYGWSEFFEITNSGGQEIITVTDPTSTTEWEHYQDTTEVTWEYPAVLSGDSIKIEVWRDNHSSFVGDFTEDFVANTGSFTKYTPLPPGWGSYDDYQIKVYDEFGNYGWSEEFDIITVDVITVTEPTASTEWMHYTTDNPVNWDTTGLQSSTIDIVLYQDGLYFEVLVTDATNNGEWIYPNAINEDWDIDLDYQIKIIDNYSDWGWSEEFTVTESSGQEIILVTEPDSTTVWTHFETGLPISWSYPEMMDTPLTDSVGISLYDGDDLVEVLIESTYNDGSWTYTGPVPMNWVPGTEYRIRIEDNSTNYGHSEYFEVASATSEIITVTEPDAETIWYHLDTNTVVEWEYPALILTSGSLSGDSVYMEIWQDGSMLDDFCSWVPNTGIYTRADSVPEEWGIGSDFQIKIIDDLDNWGFSEEFTIEQTGIEVEEGLESYKLLPIAPNPASAVFAIRFSIPETSHVTIDVFDLSGRLVASVVNQEMALGTYTSHVSGFPVGVYICRMQSGEFTASERVVVIR